MKILFLSKYQKIINRGAETFVFELSEGLNKFFDVDILDGKDSCSLKEILQRKPDVVIPINGRKQSLFSSFGRIIGGYKLVITGQSGIGTDDIWNIVFTKPDLFVALTDHNAAWAKKWAWGSSIIKIPNGVDLNKFSPDGEKIKVDLPKPIILSVGALVWYKYHERVIKAVKEAGQASLLIVGKGPEKEKLEKLGKELLGERIKFQAFDYKDIPKLYRGCDLFTLPSWDREAFGIVYLEALASGLGVVAPDDSSRREIVGEGGLFTDVSDPKAYGRCINEALKIDWSKKARKQAEKFSWDIIVSKYKQVFEDLVNK